MSADRRRGEELLAAGDRAGARALFTRALADPALDDGTAAHLHTLLGVVGKYEGRFDDAAGHYRIALDLFTAADDLAGVRHNLGGLAHSRGDLHAAERETRVALSLRADPDGPAAAADRGQLGAILSERGFHEQAERELRRTLRAVAGDPLETAIAQTALGAALHRAGRLAAAEAAYAAGLVVREELQGTTHPDLAPTLLNLSLLTEQSGDVERARTLARRAHAVLRDAVVADHPILRAAAERVAALG